MYDTIYNDQFPPGAAAYAAYVDGGIGDQPNYAYIVSEFPKAQHLSISLFGNNADAIDVESGAASPVPGSRLVRRAAQAGHPAAVRVRQRVDDERRDPADAQPVGHRPVDGPAVDRALRRRPAHLRSRQLRRAQRQRRRHPVDAERGGQRGDAGARPVAPARELLHHRSHRYHGGGIAVRNAEQRQERAHRDRGGAGDRAPDRVRLRQRRPGPAAGQAPGRDLTAPGRVGASPRTWSWTATRA